MVIFSDILDFFEWSVKGEEVFCDLVLGFRNLNLEFHLGEFFSDVFRLKGDWSAVNGGVNQSTYGAC